eukprot:gene19295-biopygen40771
MSHRPRPDPAGAEGGGAAAAPAAPMSRSDGADAGGGGAPAAAAAAAAPGRSPGAGGGPAPGNAQAIPRVRDLHWEASVDISRLRESLTASEAVELRGSAPLRRPSPPAWWVACGLQPPNAPHGNPERRVVGGAPPPPLPPSPWAHDAPIPPPQHVGRHAAGAALPRVQAVRVPSAREVASNLIFRTLRLSLDGRVL